MEIIEHARRLGKSVKLEAFTNDEWVSLTEYMQEGSVHLPDWSPPFPDPIRSRITRRARALVHGPNRAARNFARRVRVAELPQRLEMTDGTGNLMVNICRLATRRSEERRADASYQRPAAGPRNPNERLTTFGISVRLRPGDEPGMPILVGGTKRQRACYRRAVARAVGA